jgi:RNA polymerase sigma-70 factor, ECF subfamily
MTKNSKNLLKKNLEIVEQALPLVRQRKVHRTSHLKYRRFAMTNMEFNTKLSGLQMLLHSFAYNLTKNVEDAKDLYQETAYRALHNSDKFQPGTNFKAWMFTIMKNIFINNYRKKVKANTVLDNTDNQFLLNSASHSTSNNAEGGILMKELDIMLADLDDSIKVPFLMHHDGFKYQEIADELDLPLGTVKSRIFFARKELKDKILANYGFVPN